MVLLQTLFHSINFKLSILCSNILGRYIKVSLFPLRRGAASLKVFRKAIGKSVGLVVFYFSGSNARKRVGGSTFLRGGK